MTAPLMKAKQLLEHNEDLMAAVVENMQLGRLNDCRQLFSVLHKNLIGLAHDLDNYPTVDHDPFSYLKDFPDSILRSDIIDDIRTGGEVVLPKAPLPLPCIECAKLKRNSAECRLEYQHVQPSFKFSSTEVEEFVKASEILGERHRQFIIEKMAGKSKRSYRRWNNSEKYTLMVAMSILGVKETYRIAELLEDRTENQVRSFICKNFDTSALQEISEGRLPAPPPLYQPPARLALLFADPTTKVRARGMQTEMEKLVTSAIAPTSAAKVGGWNTLLSIATGIPQNFPDESSCIGPSNSINSSLLRSDTVDKANIRRASNFRYSDSLQRHDQLGTEKHHTDIENISESSSEILAQENFNDPIDVVCVSEQGQWKRNNHSSSSTKDDVVRVEYGALHSLISNNSIKSSNPDQAESSAPPINIFDENSHKNKFGLYVRPIWKRPESRPIPQEKERYVNPFQQGDIIKMGLVQDKGDNIKSKSSKSRDSKHYTDVASRQSTNNEDHFEADKTRGKRKKSNLSKSSSAGKERKKKNNSCNAEVMDGSVTPPGHSDDSNLMSGMLATPTENSVLFAPHLFEVDGRHNYYVSHDQGSLTGFEDGTTSLFGGPAFLDSLEFSNLGQNTNG